MLIYHTSPWTVNQSLCKMANLLPILPLRMLVLHISIRNGRKRLSGGMPESQGVMQDYAMARYRKVTTCARVHMRSTPKLPPPTPAVTPFSYAHATAL